MLVPGQNLDEIVVSASRRSEKVLDAPASITILSSEELTNNANVNDPIRNLINVPGIQFQQQSANSINFEMRAGSGVFGTSVFPILDYRFLNSPASGSFSMLSLVCLIWILTELRLFVVQHQHYMVSVLNPELFISFLKSYR